MATSALLSQRLSMAVLLLAVVLGAIYSNWLQRADLLIYDIHQPFSSRPAPPDMVIIAIDEYSLGQLDRWPWSRRTHAELLEKLTHAGARLVVLDIILSETDRHDPKGDKLLAKAIKRNGRVVLPMLLEQRYVGGQLLETLPLPELTAAAAGLGHAHVELDADSIARSVYLKEGLGDAYWPHLSVTMLRLLEPGGWDFLAGVRNPYLKKTAPHLLVRDNHVLMPFAGPAGHFTHVSYAKILDGSVSAETLRDKIVLVGATATGLGDFLPTSVSAYQQPMSGVEIVANTFDALRQGVTVVPMAMAERVFISVFLVLLPVLFFPRLSPRAVLQVFLTLLLGTLALTTLLLTQYQLWFPPAAPLLALSLAYPLWSWRRLDYASRFLNQELARLHNESALLLSPAAFDLNQVVATDAFDDRVRKVQQAGVHIRAMRHFIDGSLEQMAGGVAATNRWGRLTIANSKAAHYLGAAHEVHELLGQSILPLLDNLTVDGPDSWAGLLDQALTGGASVQVDVRTPRGEFLLVQMAPLLYQKQRIDGLIINFSDVSRLRESERKFADTVSFLSHDLRAPLSSLAALAEVIQLDEGLSRQDISTKIGRYTQRTLDLVDNFVQLSQLENNVDIAFEDVDITAVAANALDAIWAQTVAKKIKLIDDLPSHPIYVRGNPSYLERALLNLLNNAVKYSGEQANIEFIIEQKEGQVRCCVADTGLGIPAEAIAKIFDRYYRVDAVDRDESQGSGLGLAFVKAVVEKHNGKVTVTSTHGQGSCFCIELATID